MARSGNLMNDGESPEMMAINEYATFMGYISMTIKGLSFLIFTWITVVLLGGFVSVLQNKDFWCLTFISLVTLIETSGIFDVYLKKKVIDVLSSAYGLLARSVYDLLSNNFLRVGISKVILVRTLLVFVFVVVQILVLTILLFPLVVVHVFGLMISTGISLWRLIQHDYGGDSDEQANLKPAMDTLYYLALLQGVVFFYRFTFAYLGKNIHKVVIPTSGEDDELVAVWAYCHEIKIECEKNPSFASGRNFITHAVDLIGSKSRGDCLSGVHLLYTAICIGQRRLREETWRRNERWEQIIRQHILMKNLIISASPSPVLQKLLQILNPREMYAREMRNQAAKIVAYLALGIQLEQFPRGIQYISTLIGTFEEYCLMEPCHIDRLIHRYDKHWNGQASPLTSPAANDEDKLQEAHEKLVLRGLCILRKLATDENNCRIMSETQGLLPRIIAPLTSDIIHQFNGGGWSISVVEGSLKVMCLLVASPGKTGARVRREISNNKEAISTIERILNCHCCNVKLKKQAMGILIQLYMGKDRSMYNPAFVKMLVNIFATAGDVHTDMSIRQFAGEALARFCFQSGTYASIIFEVDGVVGHLTKILVHVENKTCRMRAAEILEHMCNIHHTQDDECISKLQKAMTSTMPKVLAEILGYDYELTKDETRERPEPNQLEIVVKENKYKEDKTSSCTHPGYKEDESDVDVEEDESENEEDEDEHYRRPLLSLCVTVCDTFIGDDQDLARQFDPTSLPKKLEEMVKRNRVPAVCCLRLMKLTCKMVIWMMKHNGSYVKDELDSLMNALSSASKIMVHLDMTMVFATEDDGAPTTKPVRSLHSLFKEAKESVETRRAAQAHEPESMEPSTSNPRQ